MAIPANMRLCANPYCNHRIAACWLHPPGCHNHCMQHLHQLTCRHRLCLRPRRPALQQFASCLAGGCQNQWDGLHALQQVEHSENYLLVLQTEILIILMHQSAGNRFYCGTVANTPSLGEPSARLISNSLLAAARVAEPIQAWSNVGQER